MSDPRAIGFFDSGVGGLTVLREVMRRLPGKSTIYVGDNARAPYGPRSDEEVIRFSGQCLDELAARDVKAIVVACNTSSAIALPHLRLRYDRPLLGVVRPGATAAALATRNRRVGVIATVATVRSRAYFQAIKEEDPFVEVDELATPQLVPLVEAGQLDGQLVEDVVAEQIAPMLDEQKGIDTLLLGCTHYPLLAPVIRRIIGSDVAVIDSASATASALAALLEMHSLAAPADSPTEHVQLTTGDVEQFSRIAGRLFESTFTQVRHLELPGVAVPVRGTSGDDRRVTASTTFKRNLRGNERAVLAGIAVGAGLAIATRYITQRAKTSPDLGLVDWQRVEDLAVARLDGAPGALSFADLHAADDDYARALATAIPLLEQHLGRPLPGVVERHEVVTRADWARANIVTFEQLISHLEPQTLSATGEKGVAAGLARAANRFITTQQLGFLLGYLGTRVLGQYDIALLSAEANPGKLLFVDENVRQTAALLGIPASDFRTWIVLHEATHAFEFEANDWIRPFIRNRLEQQLAGVLDQARDLQAGGVSAFLERMRDARENPITAFLSPEQRRLFEETDA